MNLLAQFKKLHKVTIDEIDDLGHVNNVVYLKWAQDIAADHWHAKATPDMKIDFLWVVASHQIFYKRPCFLHDVIQLKTAVIPDVNGATWGRKVWMENNAKLAAEVYTQWCLINSQTKKPVRIPQQLLTIFNG
jgi:acyl-CoA thioester hydrolase